MLPVKATKNSFLCRKHCEHTPLLDHLQYLVTRPFILVTKSCICSTVRFDGAIYGELLGLAMEPIHNTVANVECFP
jgi:hypothetical protein